VERKSLEGVVPNRKCGGEYTEDEEGLGGGLVLDIVRDRILAAKKT
jgi:hypothetical protein